MKLKKWELSLALGLVLTLFTGAVWAADVEREQAQLAGKLLRLHVIANSDSDADQALKLKVRDAVFSAASQWVRNVSDSAAAEAVILAHQPELERIAQQAVANSGYAYPVRVELGISDFPTKDYAGFSLPAGRYRALRVIIGAGAGRNWWCVVFPPLCIQAATESLPEQAAQAGLTEGQVALITESDERYEYRFKSIELWQALKDLFG